MEKNISFTKMNGAGNDFILISRPDLGSALLNTECIRKACDRRFGIGADGLLIIDRHPSFDFSIDFYNADGSPGSFCANGSRAAVLFARQQQLIAPETGSVKFLFGESAYTASVISETTVRLHMGEPVITAKDIPIQIDSITWNGTLINTGSPHVVIAVPEETNDLSEMAVTELGALIRRHLLFAPGGVNVNFIQKQNGEWIIRTYERGVEAETLSCGTGVTAAAVFLAERNEVSSPIFFHTRGGASLCVEFDFYENRCTNLRLSGPAHRNFTGKFSINDWSNNG